MSVGNLSDSGVHRVSGIPFVPVARSAASPRATLDDDVLIRQAQAGNPAAFEQLVGRYDRAVLRVAIHMTGSQEDAQDIYQEAFLRAYINLARFRFECSFYTWIYRIVMNLCLDHLRKRPARAREVTTAVTASGDENPILDRIADNRPDASPEKSMAGRELRDRILRALARLSPRERIVFELKHYHGLKLRTVADMLETTEGTIKNTLFRATHKLRAQLADVR
jgi:RNA polymerase sigma-70 factor (ECF subfamily)